MLSKKTISLLIIILTLLVSNLLIAQGGGTRADFTGGNHYLDLGDNYKYVGDFTIEMWVYKSSWSVTSTEKIISCTQTGGYNIRIVDDASGDKIQFAYRNTADNDYLYIDYAVSGLSVGWHHIAVTHSTTDADLYVDGINTDGEGSDMTGGYDDNNHLILGAEAGGGTTPTGEYFTGYIDEVRIWNRKLSQTEITGWKHKQITSSQRPSYHTNLQGYYKMDTPAAGWAPDWLDDAANNVTTNSEIDLINYGASTSTSTVPIGDLPSGYTTDAEAIWYATDADWGNESTGLALQDYSTSTITVAEYYCYANNNLTGTTTDDCPSETNYRSATIWFIDDNSDDEINLKFDFSDFGASTLDNGVASDSKLLKRSGTSGDFSVVASASSTSSGEVIFENYMPSGDAYYSIGRNILFIEHTIEGDFDGATSVFATDIDGDGDMDVLGAANLAYDVTWWENDGSEVFTRHTIDYSFIRAKSVYAADIDDDGDMDVLGAAYNSDDITWWENNSSESFTEHIIDDNFYGAISVYATDIDGDGDVDVLGAANVADDIAWWENNGSEVFTKYTIDDDFNGAVSVYATDIDGDGDVDILGAAMFADDISWWRNNGSEVFTKRIIDNFDGASSVYATDIDGDGDMDILGAAFYAHDITWWENDGNEVFTQHIIDGSFNGASSVFATDLDGDGDVDVLGAADNADDITWWENNGSEVFTKHTIKGDFDGAISVYATDLDGDGDMDVLGAADNADDITWWEQKESPSATTTFTDGSTFAPSITPGQEHQVIGRFQLTSTNTFSLICAEIKLNGTRTGASDFRLWQSSDATFNSSTDIQLGSMVNFDPGNGKTIVFEKGFASPINSSGTYYFLTCDIAADATGEIEPLLVNSTSLKYSGGTLNGSISNVPLSSGASPLPVELTSFAAHFDKLNDQSVVLNWTTATEVDNYGFEVQVSTSSTTDGSLSWSKCGFVEGHGNSNSPKEYSYTDKPTDGSSFSYRLKQIDTDGSFAYSEIVEVEIGLPTKFELFQNYPNPFNPSTTIKYSLPNASDVTLKIYDTIGQEITVLVNEQQEAGRYTVTFDASHIVSGIYIYRLETKQFTNTKILILIK